MKVLVSKYNLLKIIILWCFFSSIILAFAYKLFEINFNILFLKDLGLITILLLATRFSTKVSFFSISFFLFLIYLLLCFLFSDAILMPRISSVRQMLIPFLLVFMGFAVKSDSIDLVKRYMIKIGILVVLMGFIEVYYSVWHFIDITDYFKIKEIPVFDKTFKRFYNYPVFFTEPLFGGVKRMTSTLLDPINLGHSFAIIISLLVFDETLKYSKINKRLLIILFSIGLILTFSKGALLQLILFLFIANNRISIIMKVIILVVFTMLLYYASNFHFGIRLHLHGIETALKNINLLGHGVGKVGNQAFMFGEQSIEYGDTFFGSLLGQIGIIGYFLWILPFIIIINKLKFNVISKILISQLLLSLISENAFNFLSIFLVCIILGLEYRKALSNE